MQAQIGQPVQVITPGDAQRPVKDGQIRKIEANGTVDVVSINASSTFQDLPYVEVGGTPPVGVNYAQEISLA
jgi:hypothetical protein